MILKINNLCFSYGSRELIKNMRIELNKGEVVSIIGPNGAGKSTLLKCIASILKPSSGSVYINMKDIKDITKKELAKIQGYVPQNYYSSFDMNVMDTVLLGRKPYIKWKTTEKDLEIVLSALKYLELEDMCHRSVAKLSGGERQKVMIARALAQQPDIILLDEPTSALDLAYALDVLELVKKLAKEENKLIILVMHQIEMAARYSDKLILLKNGKVHSIGSAEEVISTKNLEEVYGVNCIIEESEFGMKITPIERVRKNRR